MLVLLVWVGFGMGGDCGVGDGIGGVGGYCVVVVLDWFVVVLYGDYLCVGVVCCVGVY